MNFSPFMADEKSNSSMPTVYSTIIFKNDENFIPKFEVIEFEFYQG